MRAHTKRTVFVSGLVVVAAVVALAFTLGSSAGTPAAKTPNASPIVAAGTPVTLSSTATARLAIAGITQSYLLATRNGRSYYRFVKQNGTLCYGVSAVTNPDPPGMVICLNSTNVPQTIDFSVYQSETNGTGLSVWRLEGLDASPNVAAIDLIGPDGQVAASVPITNGVYYDQPTSAIPVSAVESVDDAGNVITKTVLPQAPSTAPTP